MKNIILFIFTLFFINNAIANDKALMVLRFNDDSLSYEQQLKKVIEKVSKLKPNAEYKLVSLVNKNNIDHAEQYAITNAKKVASSMIKMGVSKANIKASYQNNDSVEVNEIHIFVN